MGLTTVKSTVREAADKVLAAAANTKQAIVALGAGLVAVALLALAALLVGGSALRKVRAS